jgi:tetratricopeptide (TPR) repeat protein
MSVLRVALVTVSAVFIALHVSACGSWFQGSPALYRAEELSQQERYDEAIVMYREHIEDRLKERNRPEWENPHFYLLRIGDLQLRMEQPAAALESYHEAEQRGVEESLLSDRYRALAQWYSERGKLNEAFQVLKKNRGRDTLLFDAMLDRVGRELTATENAKPTSIP